MYAMSWEVDNREYKYESIQDYTNDYYDEEDNNKDLSLEELLEDGFDFADDEELDLEEMEK